MSECEKLRVGKEFLLSHKWPVVLCKPGHDRCYCSQCYPPSHSDTYPVGGQIYVIPRRWTRFGVYVDEPFAAYHGVWKTWANCFHGTSIENAKSIVEHRQLLLPFDMTLDGKKLQIREGHIPGEYFFFTTPTIRYAALDCYAHTYNFKSPKTNKHYQIKVALQCKQKSDSFIVQPETVGAREHKQQICPYVSNDHMEWKTKQRSSIMPYGLMLQIESDDEQDDDSDDDDSAISDKSQTINCPHCFRRNLWKNGNYAEGKVVTCVYTACKRKFQEVKCPHCSGSNTWKNAVYKEGQVITCAYEKCKRKFQQVSCPHCSGSNTWKNADYRDGQVVTCAHVKCKRKFQQVSCPHCLGSNTWKNADYREGQVVTCAYELCNRKFQQISCAYCFGSNTWEDADYKEGKVTTCAYDNCKKNFQKVSCPHCSRSNSWKNADYCPGQITTCAYEDCKKKFQKVYCPHCFGSVIWKDAYHQPGTMVTCPYKTCGKKFSTD